MKNRLKQLLNKKKFRRTVSLLTAFAVFLGTIHISEFIEDVTEVEIFSHTVMAVDHAFPWTLDTATNQHNITIFPSQLVAYSADCAADPEYHQEDHILITVSGNEGPIDCPFDNSCSKIVANGDLILNQKSPIKVSSIPLGIYYVTEDLLKVDLGESRYDIFYYYNKYNNRNFTTKFKPKDIFYTPGKSNEEENFSIELEMNVPKLQEIMYYDSIYGTLKNTFVQYIFISVFVFYVLWYLLDFILRNRVFYCSIYGDIEADDAINY